MNAHFGFTLAASIFGFLVILAWRIRETQSPVTILKIVAPPLGMATGMCMFFVPAFRVPWLWAIISLGLGAIVLAYPLLRTTNLHSDLSTGSVRVKRSPAFFIVFIVLALVRFFAKQWIGQFVSIPQTAALFYLLAFGMIVRWRVGMVRQFLRISAAAAN